MVQVIIRFNLLQVLMLIKQEIFSYPRNLIFVTFCKSQILPQLDHPPSFIKEGRLSSKFSQKKGGGESVQIFPMKREGLGKQGSCLKQGGDTLSPFFNWDSLHARLNSHYKALSYKKKKHKKLRHTGNLFRKNLQLKIRVLCSRILLPPFLMQD